MILLTLRRSMWSSRGIAPLAVARFVPGPYRLLQVRPIRLSLGRKRHRIARENDRDRLTTRLL